MTWIPLSETLDNMLLYFEDQNREWCPDCLDLQGAASPMEVEGELPDMNAEEMAKEGFYLVKSVLRHLYRQCWRFLTLWEGFGVEEATWEPFSAFVLPEGRLNSVLVDYLSQNNLGELLRLAETLASKTKGRD